MIKVFYMDDRFVIEINVKRRTNDIFTTIGMINTINGTKITKSICKGITFTKTNYFYQGGRDI
jgi:hypothetical protein